MHNSVTRLPDTEIKLLCVGTWSLQMCVSPATFQPRKHVFQEMSLETGRFVQTPHTSYFKVEIAIGSQPLIKERTKREPACVLASGYNLSLMKASVQYSAIKVTERERAAIDVENTPCLLHFAALARTLFLPKYEF